MSRGIIIDGAALQEVLREHLQTALAKEDVSASEHAEFYLVNLLNNFHTMESRIEREGADSLEKPLALLLMDAMSGDQSTKIRCLKQLGDTALVLSGFFADRIRRTVLDVPYYVSMGGQAYISLASAYSGHKVFVELFTEMSAKFSDFVDVLAHVAPWNSAASNSDIVRIYERWLETGDEKLKDLLENQGIAVGH